MQKCRKIMQGLYYENELLQYHDTIEKPIQQSGESLIRVRVAAICNTDKEILRGYKPDFKGILGHEFVGIVEQSEFPQLIGKRVVGELNAGCGNCVYCKTNREKHCLERKVIGIHNKWGCFAEYMTIATHLLHIVPDTLSDEKAVFTESLAAALEIVQSNHLKPDEPVAIVGSGKLSYMITQILALHGIKITVFGRTLEKLKRFTPYARIQTSPQGSFETVIEASGSPTGYQTAVSLVRHKGKIIVKSTYADTITIDLSYLVVNEIQLIGSRCGPFEPALTLLQNNSITLPDLEMYPLTEYKKAFASQAFKSGFRISTE